MRIEFWGVRGAYPTPEPDKLRYGGNTNCVVVTSQDAPGSFFLLDAGIGAARFGATLDLGQAQGATVLLSHLHLHHIIGLQFTPFAFSPNYNTLVIGPHTKDASLEQIFDTIMEPYYSPVYGLKNLLAKVRFQPIDSAPLNINGLQIQALPFEHTPDTQSWGYRLSDSQGTIVYLTDTILYDEEGELVPAAQQLCQDADLLIVGADDPYHVSENSTTYEDALHLARHCGVGHLVLYHHHPAVTDDELDELQALLRLQHHDLAVTIAAEQMVIEL